MDYLYWAELAEQSKRFEDMKDYLKYYLAEESVVSEEFKDLFYRAYKSLLAQARRALANMSCSNHKAYAFYKNHLENLVGDLCDEALYILDKRLTGLTKSTHNTVFYYKMKADLFRYLAEFQCSEDNIEKFGTVSSQKSLRYYEAASDLALSSLEPYDPLRLSLALNFSVYYNDILKSTERACNVCRAAIVQAQVSLKGVSDAQTKEACQNLIELLTTNLSIWTQTLIN